MAEVQKSSQQAGEMAQQFVQFVMLQAQNILFVLGKIPTPEGTLMQPNLPAAKLLIDQLEMIKFKTQGNLNTQEAKILEDTLTNVQLSFVETSGGTPASMMPKMSMEEDIPKVDENKDAPQAPQTSQPKESPQVPPPSDDDDEKKKFFKSYG